MAQFHELILSFHAYILEAHSCNPRWQLRVNWFNVFEVMNFVGKLENICNTLEQVGSGKICMHLFLNNYLS